jgi:hypothetical protein
LPGRTAITAELERSFRRSHGLFIDEIVNINFIEDPPVVMDN